MSPPLALDNAPARLADFQRLFDVNVSGPFYLSRALVRSWLSLPIPVDGTGTSSSLDITSLKGDKAVNLGKQILFVSSISGLVAMTPQRQAAYNASKGAVTMLSKVSAASAASAACTGSAASAASGCRGVGQVASASSAASTCGGSARRER
jgi:sorbose reductase